MLASSLLTPLPDALSQLGVDVSTTIVEDTGHLTGVDPGGVRAQSALQSDAIGAALPSEDGVRVGVLLGHRRDE